jgi:hypothetical protein
MNFSFKRPLGRVAITLLLGDAFKSVFWLPTVTFANGSFIFGDVVVDSIIKRFLTVFFLIFGELVVVDFIIIRFFRRDSPDLVFFLSLDDEDDDSIINFLLVLGIQILYIIEVYN